jgi:hypothetical protein
LDKPIFKNAETFCVLKEEEEKPCGEYRTRRFIEKRKNNMKIKREEEIIQSFPHRCPYCDQVISYDQFDLKIGENEIECPLCKRNFIKVLGPSLTEGDHRSRRQ